MNSRKPLGFTIVEMIVVVSIVAILVAILIPALSGAKNRSKKLQELNLASHICKAWAMYSNDHLDKVLPGFLSRGVQQQRDLAWAFPNESLVPPAPNYFEADPNDAGPWTFRLLPYLDYDWRSLLFYREAEWTSNELREYANVVSTQPAFGYNGFYLGGWWEIDGHSNKPVVTFGSVSLSDERRRSVVTKHSSSIKRADKQIVFCSTFYAPEGNYNKLDDNTPGTHFAVPSVLARVVNWIPSPDNRMETRTNTYAPLGRFNGDPAICFADGSVQSVQTETLLDQSLWIPVAETIGDIPAENFSHTLY